MTKTDATQNSSVRRCFLYLRIILPPPSVLIHILHDNTLSQENRDNFNYIAGRYNQQVKFYNVEELCANEIEKLKNFLPNILGARFSIATLYRLLIPNLFNEIKKIIYLDADTIVNLDINELWQVELGEKALGGLAEIEIDVGHHIALPTKFLINEGYVNSEDYFNGGVLLLNLEKIRKEKDKLFDGIKFVAEHPQCKWFDQDILNYCFSKDYVKLNEKFDAFVHCERIRGNSSKIRPAIYHYVGNGLQLNLQDKLNELWLKYFEKTSWFKGETIGHIYEGVRQMYVEQKDFAVKISATVAGKERAFFTAQDNIKFLKQIFYIQDNEEIIASNSQESVQKLIKSLNKSRGRKIFFILENYPAVHSILTQAGFVEGRDFLNAMLFLSDAHGVPFDSHSLIKLL